MRKAYEYALNHIGHDKDSNEIWTDYIQFLKSGEVRVHAHLEAWLAKSAFCRPRQRGTRVRRWTPFVKLIKEQYRHQWRM